MGVMHHKVAFTSKTDRFSVACIDHYKKICTETMDVF